MSEGREPGEAGRGRGFAAATSGVLAAAAVLRLLRWRESWVGDVLVPPDGDSLYHLRRAVQLASGGEAYATFDPGVNWPHGAHVPWAPGFDLAAAGLARLASALGAPPALGVAVLPVLVGVAVVGLAMALAHAVAPAPLRRAAALGAGLLAALIPQAVASSRFARTDHHVAEAALMAALALWAARGASGERRGARYELAGALLAGAGVLVFTGAPLYVAIAATPLAARALASRGLAPLPGPGAAGLLAGAALAALASAPLVASHGHAISFAFPSMLQPALVALAGTGIALASVAARAGTPARRAAVLAALLAGATALAALVPGLAAQALAGVRGWLLAGDPWIARIDEFQPAWAVGLARVHGMWGVAGLALPALAPVAAAAARRRGGAGAAALLFQGLALAALAALQVRFGRVAIPVLAASGGVALAAACARLPVRAGLAAALAPALCAGALAADPAVWRTIAPAPAGPPDPLVSAALDLRAAGPGSGGPGVLAAWDMGHEILVLSGHPVVANGFGSYLDAAGYAETQRAFTLREQELLEWMRSRRLGYVVAGASTFHGRVPGPDDREPFTAAAGGARLDLEYLRAVPLAASMLGGSGVPGAGVSHLEHLLPRFASLQMFAGLAFALPALWTFETVPGARVEGCARPGARVVLEVDLAERSRPHVWRAWGDADMSGRFAITVPLPTGYARPTLRTGPRARLRAGDGPAVALEIPESAVRSGGRLAAGSCPPS